MRLSKVGSRHDITLGIRWESLNKEDVYWRLLEGCCWGRFGDTAKRYCTCTDGSGNDKVRYR